MHRCARLCTTLVGRERLAFGDVCESVPLMRLYHNDTHVTRIHHMVSWLCSIHSTLVCTVQSLIVACCLRSTRKLRIHELRISESRFLGSSLWTQEFHPLVKLRICSSRTL